jgi:hypothetical protein
MDLQNGYRIFQKAGNQQAIIGGVFLVFAAIVSGVFLLVKGCNNDPQIHIEQKLNGNNSNQIGVNKGTININKDSANSHK